MVIFMVVGKDVRHVGSMAEMSGHRMPRGMLFLGAHNAARSQIAEGWARHLFPAGVSVFSAGSEPAAAVDPNAVRVMQEVGVDISSQRPKPVGDVPLGDIDTVITVCAEEACALPPGGLVQHHWALDDPTVADGTDDEVLGAYRKTREDIRRRLEELLEKSR
jgi:arsenate reductase